MASRRRFLRTAATGPTAMVVGTLLTGCLGDEEREASGETNTSKEPRSYEDTDVGLLNGNRTEVLAFLSTHESDSPQHWHFEPLRVRLGENVTITPRIDDRVVENFSFEEYDFRARPVDEDQDIIRLNGDGEYIHISGERVGETQVVFEVMKDNQTVYDTIPFGIRVITLD